MPSRVGADRLPAIGGGLRPFLVRFRGPGHAAAVPDAGRPLHPERHETRRSRRPPPRRPLDGHARVDWLIAAGLADRLVNPDNRHETLLRLTAEGRRTVEEVTARRRTEIAAIVERLSPEKRRVPIDALAAFNGAAGSPRPGRRR